VPASAWARRLVIFRYRETLPAVIGVRGARHDNLRDAGADVPLWRTVAVAGVSGSGKTSLAMGTLYAEGLHRFLDSPRCSAATAPIMTGWP
jgi:excinuclease UvrABC ATPase subunit